MWPQIIHAVLQEEATPTLVAQPARAVPSLLSWRTAAAFVGATDARRRGLAYAIFGHRANIRTRGLLVCRVRLRFPPTTPNVIW